MKRWNDNTCLLYTSKYGEGRFKVLTLINSFHGRTVKMCIRDSRYERLARKYRRTLGYGPYVAFKLKIAQIIEEGLREALAAAKICNCLLYTSRCV